MVKGGTGFRKQASKRRRNICQKKLHLSKKGSNHHVPSKVDEIADNSIVDINLNIVVGDKAVPGPTYGLQNNQEVHFNNPVSERKLKEVSLGIDYWMWTYK